MHTLLALAAHSALFVASVLVFAPAGVTSSAWLALYFAGAAAVLPGPQFRLSPARLGLAGTAQLLLYSGLLASLFFAADQALAILGNSVKPRAALPSFLGGLELYFMLFPGLASVALGAFIRCLAQRLFERAAHARQSRARTSASGA